MNTESNGELIERAFWGTYYSSPNHLLGIFLRKADLNNKMNGPNLEVEGSFFPQKNLYSAGNWIINPDVKWDWEELPNPEGVDARLFRANIPGKVGMKSLMDIHPDTQVVLAPPPKGGNLFPLILADEKEWEDTPNTYVVIGTRDPEHPFFVTIFLGEYIPPSKISEKQVPKGRRIVTAAQAFDLGFTHAKMVREGAFRKALEANR